MLTRGAGVEFGIVARVPVAHRMRIGALPRISNRSRFLRKWSGKPPHLLRNIHNTVLPLSTLLKHGKLKSSIDLEASGYLRAHTLSFEVRVLGLGIGDESFDDPCHNVTILLEPGIKTGSGEQLACLSQIGH